MSSPDDRDLPDASSSPLRRASFEGTLEGAPMAPRSASRRPDPTTAVPISRTRHDGPDAAPDPTDPRSPGPTASERATTEGRDDAAAAGPPPPPPLGASTPDRRGGAVRTVGRGVGRATRGSARLTARTSRYAAAKYHGYTHSGGAGASGLARLTELHASHAAGDTAMTLALAGTLFFNPQTAQARGQVALFLLLTMVPFALTAPLIGPLLDRFRHGRRWAIGTTLAARAFLCWVLGEAINNASGWLFPAALGCLVASKAYTIARAAAVPRLLPPGTTLVKANSKVSMAGVLGAVVGGVVGGAALWVGPAWALRAAFVMFVVGTVQAIRLPARVDSSYGERNPEETAPIPVQSPADRSAGFPTVPLHHDTVTIDSLGPIGRFRRRVRAIPWPVMHAMWSTGGTRLLTGFLIMFMAFLAKEHPIDGVRGELVLGLLVLGIGVGNALGSMLGNVIKDYRPEKVAMVSVLAATATCVATGIWYGVWTLVIMGLVQGLSAQLSKLCFDALVQREVPENVQASVFAWSETMLQILWVVGGSLGIILPLNPHIGFPICALGLLGTVVMAARQRKLAAPSTARRSRSRGEAPGAPA
ncbi:MAG: MFS transporter [Terracoccus sp.]